MCYKAVNMKEHEIEKQKDTFIKFEMNFNVFLVYILCYRVYIKT